MPTELLPYQAYLLRLWQADREAGGCAGWRASLEDPRTGERLGFASLEQLFVFLLALTESEAEQRRTPPPADSIDSIVPEE
jgi:hypothetical protein